MSTALFGALVLSAGVAGTAFIHASQVAWNRATIARLDIRLAPEAKAFCITGDPLLEDWPELLAQLAKYTILSQPSADQARRLQEVYLSRVQQRACTTIQPAGITPWTFRTDVADAPLSVAITLLGPRTSPWLHVDLPSATHPAFAGTSNAIQSLGMLIAWLSSAVLGVSELVLLPDDRAEKFVKDPVVLFAGDRSKLVAQLERYESRARQWTETSRFSLVGEQTAFALNGGIRYLLLREHRRPGSLSTRVTLESMSSSTRLASTQRLATLVAAIRD